MPNVVLITTDQQRFDSLGCNGSAWMRTPVLDGLAKEGARFERAYCANPVCTPSRVSIMTGQLPSRHGSYNIGTVAADCQRFLSTVLSDHGYRTHQLGKAHFYPWDTRSPETLRPEGTAPFRDFAGFQTAELTVGHTDWGVTGHYEAWLAERGIRKGHHMPQLQVKRLFEGDAYQAGDWGMPVALHSGEWIVDRVRAFLEERDPAQPFYLNIGFQDPHHPLSVPEEWPKIPPERIPLPAGRADRRIGPQKALRDGTIEETWGGPFGIAGNQDTVWKDVPEETVRAVRSYYYSMVELFDRQMGELISLLKAFGVFDDTLLIVTSDHGDMLFDHGIGEKGPVAFEEVLRVPLLMCWSGKIRPQAVEEPVSLTDLYPTILDFLDISCPAVCDGISLTPLLRGGCVDREGVRAEFREERDAVRYRCFITKDWKLVEYQGASFGELYHLKEDPKEERNLWFDPAFEPTKYRLLRAMLDEADRHVFLAERPCRC